MNDSPEIQAKKLIKYGNEKFGLNETTLRGVLDNAKATEDLDAELNEQDGLLNSFEIEINKFPDKGAQKITLEIPSSFGTISSVSSLYYTRINNKVFFSMSSNVGLWVYDIDTDTTEQIFSLGGGWQYFTQVSETKWLITGTGSYATGVALYDSDKNTVRQITTTGASWDTFQQVTDTKWLISGRNSRAKGLLLFNSDNDTISIAFDDSTNFYGWYYFNQIDNDRWFVTAQSSGTTGILLFDARTDTATKIYNSGNRWQYFTQVGEEEWLIRGSNSGNGVVLGDLSTNTFTVLSSTYGCSLTQQISDTEYLVFGNSSGLIFLYDATNKKLTQAYSSGNSSTFNRICKINNDKYLIGSAGSYLGILLYNVQNNTFKQIYTSRSWGIFHQVSEYKWLISCTMNNDGKGLLLYNSTDDSITQIYTVGYNWQHYYKVDDDRWLIGGETGGTGVLLYKLSTDSVVSKYSYGYKYDTFNKDGDILYILSSDKSVNPFTLSYNDSDDSVKLVKCYLGEV